MTNNTMTPREREAARQRAWEEFKRTRDQQIADEKRHGGADVLLEEKLRRINSALDQTE